jgi:hypothetical protein
MSNDQQENELPSKYVKPLPVGERYISPHSPDHPQHGVEDDPQFPPLPLPRHKWLLDFRRPMSPIIYYNGRVIGRVQKLEFQADVEGRPKVVMTIDDPDLIASLEDTEVTVVPTLAHDKMKEEQGSEVKDSPTY